MENNITLVRLPFEFLMYHTGGNSGSGNVKLHLTKYLPHIIMYRMEHPCWNVTLQAGHHL